MKLSYRDIEPFVKSPNPKARVILIYGPDHGLMKERSDIIGKTIVADLNDPFNVVALSSEDILEDPERLSVEANSISMMGGQKLIRIENATDKVTEALKAYLTAPSNETLIIAQAGELSPRSALRKLCESAENAAALPCYVEDEQSLARLIRETILAANLTIDQDAIRWLAANIAGDRQKVRSALDKLICYKGKEPGAISLEDAQMCCGAASAIALDDLVYSTAGNNTSEALKIYTQLLEEGTAFISILRALQTHFRKLHVAKCEMDGGKNADLAMKALSPPIFFKQQPAFKAQLSRWSTQGIMNVLQKLAELEAQCKTTGMPVETLCAQAVLGISKSR